MPKQSSEQSDTLSPGAEAYLWGYPLMAVHRTRLLLCSRHQAATLNHIDNLATPADRAIVVPNNDTLYSSGWYDLRYGDLTIEVPAMDHAQRYWNVMIVDAYTHVAYVCRRYHGTNGTQVRVTYDPSTPPANDNSDVVPIATPTAWVIIRVLVEAPKDLAIARSLQRSITVREPASHPHEFTKRVGKPTAMASAGAEYFEELRQYVQLDPPAPWHPPLSAEAALLLENLVMYSEAELAAYVDEGEDLMKRHNLNGTVKRNGWSTGRDATGFGQDIIKRALGAKFGGL